MKYVIDTNILINLIIYLPIEHHPTFWKWLERQIKEGHIIILDVVAEECKHGNIKKWVYGAAVKRYIVNTDDLMTSAAEIEKEYKLITKEEDIIKSKADPIIIAYAQKNSGVGVFTQERKKKPGETQNKIPDVCEALGVPYDRWPEKVWKVLHFKKI